MAFLKSMALRRMFKVRRSTKLAPFTFIANSLSAKTEA